MSAAGRGGGAALVAPRGLSGAVAAWSVAVLLVAGTIAGLLLVSTRARRAAPAPYQLVTVSRGAIEGTLLVPGRLQAERTVRVGTVAPGQVVAVTVAVGDRVARGQILARMDDLEQRRKVEVEDAQLGVAELRGLQAEKRLFELVKALEGDGVSPDDVRLDNLMPGALGDAQLAVLATTGQLSGQARALALAKELLARRAVRAPVAGVILEEGVTSGETVGASPPGPPLFVIAPDLSRLVLRAEVDERHAAAVRPGIASFGLRGAAERPFRGEVRRSAAAALAGGPPRHEVVLDVANPSGALRPGLRTVVALPMRSDAKALYVARGAVAREPADAQTGTVAFVESDGELRVVPVEIGVANEALVEIRGAAVAAGARVFLPR